MIEVFKTNIDEKHSRQQVIRHLQLTWPQARVTIDITDCDRVLRIENPHEPIDARKVIELVKNEGFYCDILTH